MGTERISAIPLSGSIHPDIPRPDIHPRFAGIWIFPASSIPIKYCQTSPCMAVYSKQPTTCSGDKIEMRSTRMLRWRSRQLNINHLAESAYENFSFSTSVPVQLYAVGWVRAGQQSTSSFHPQRTRKK